MPDSVMRLVKQHEEEIVNDPLQGGAGGWWTENPANPAFSAGRPGSAPSSSQTCNSKAPEPKKKPKEDDSE